MQVVCKYNVPKYGGMQADIYQLEARFLLLPTPCQAGKGTDSSKESQAGLGPGFSFL